MFLCSLLFIFHRRKQLTSFTMQCHGFCRHFYSSTMAMIFIRYVMYFDFPLPSLPNLDLPISYILSLLPLCRARACVCKILTYLQIVLNQNSIFKRNLIYAFVPYPTTLVGLHPSLWNGMWSPSGMLTSHKDTKTLVKAVAKGTDRWWELVFSWVPWSGKCNTGTLAVVGQCRRLVQEFVLSLWNFHRTGR